MRFGESVTRYARKKHDPDGPAFHFQRQREARTHSFLYDQLGPWSRSLREVLLEIVDDARLTQFQDAFQARTGDACRESVVQQNLAVRFGLHLDKLARGLVK